MGWPHVDSVQATLGLAVNPPKMRSQHQLHLHVARIKLALRKALTNKAKYSGSVPIPTGVDALYAMYIPSANINSAFGMTAANMEPVATAAGHPGKGPDAGHHSIMVVPGEDGQGYYLVMAYNVHVENYLCQDIKAGDAECDYYWRMQ